MEGTVLRVPCNPSKRRCGFWRSSVTSAGPPSPGVGRGCRSLTAARRAPSARCAGPAASAAPPPGRAARDALSCAHALPVAAHSTPRLRTRRGSTVWVAPTPLRYTSRLSASWATRRPARQGRFNHVSGRLQTSRTSLTIRHLWPHATKVRASGRTFQQHSRTFSRASENVPKRPNVQTSKRPNVQTSTKTYTRP